jgi:Ca2+-binding RTX toxin-like protein
MAIVTSAFLLKGFYATSQAELDILFDVDRLLLLSQFGTFSSDQTFTALSGNSVIVYDGCFSYQGRLASFVSGAGHDQIFIGAETSQIVGNIFVDSGAGDDLIVTGYIEGSNSFGAGISAGSGNDVIRVLDTYRGAGIFANAAFHIDAGDDDDSVALEGTQYNLLGANINIVDGGSGFDSFFWNLSYDLGCNTNQTGIDATFPTYPLEIGVQNFERLILNPTLNGHLLTLVQADVLMITAGSVFDRSNLGLSFTGTGDTLFLEYDEATVNLDLSSWILEGTSTAPQGLGFSVYSSGSALLVVDPRFSAAPTVAPRQVILDGIAGGALRLADYFPTLDSGATFTVADHLGAAISYASWDQSTQRIVVAGGGVLPPTQTFVITEHLTVGTDVVRSVDATFTDLTFNPIAVVSPFPFATIADVNGDGRIDLFGAFQNLDGSFTSFNVASQGLGILSADGRVLRDNRLIDFDNNGTLDLVANTYATSSAGPNISRLFSGDGTGNFAEVQAFADKIIQGYGETIIAADFNNDGLTDFYLPHYQRNDPSAPPAPGEENHNGNYNGPPVVGSRLMINHGGFDFEDQTALWDVTNSAGSLSLKGFGASYDFTVPEGGQALDFNRDGLIDFWVGSHLFLNQSGSFYDANRAFGLPIKFDEGALLFDWDNDGDFDLLKILPEHGPVLYQFDSVTMHFEEKEVFDDNLFYEDAYGISTGDLNGDGWLDVYVGQGQTLTPRIFLNDSGVRFTEYRSLQTENIQSNAGPVLGDINGDGKSDIVLGRLNGILVNSTANTANTVTIELLGPNGERNQHGRIVELVSTNPLDTRIMARVVDGGSGYISQSNYELQFADSAAGTYTARAYLIDYPNAESVRIDFQAVSGHKYTVKAASDFAAAQVFDTTLNASVPFERTYATNDLDDSLVINAAGHLHLNGYGGDDAIQIFTTESNDWAGSTFSGGTGNDFVAFQQIAFDTTLGGPTPTLALSGDAGDDVLGFLGLDQINVTIDGGAGCDNIGLVALNGNATLSLGSEADTVTFAAGPVAAFASSNIVVTDFETGLLGDQIDWTNFLQSWLVGWDGLINPFLTGHMQLVLDGADSLLELNRDGSGFSTFIRFQNVTSGFVAFNLGGYINYANRIGTINGETLSGDGGRDYFQGKGGPDTMVGFDGDDVYLVDSQDDQVIEATNGGFDTIYSSSDYSIGAGQEIEVIAAANGYNQAPLSFYGNEFGQRIEGNDASNMLYGGDGADNIVGGGGNDILSGDLGVNILDGGTGSDTALYNFETTSVSVTLNGAGFATVYVGNLARDTLSNIENIIGGFAGDVLTGDNRSNTLDGRGGADVMAGGSNDDLYIVDNLGDLIVEGVGNGNDRVVADISYNLNFGAEVEVLSTRTHAATDTIVLRGNEYSQTIYGNAGVNTLDGRGGTDTLIGFGGDDLYIVGNSAVRIKENVGGGNDRIVADVSYVLTSAAEVETLSTRTHADVFAINLSGNEYGQLLQGNFGANTLDGRGGMDRLEGYKGDDLYIVDNIGDVIVEAIGEGKDRVVADVSYILDGYAEIETLSTRTHADTFSINLTGNGFGQTLQGNFGVNTLDGRGGADRLEGYKGDDLYIVDNAADLVVELIGEGVDRVVADVSYIVDGYAEVETLSTRTHADTFAINLTGNGFDQSIQGNFGVNTLDGRGGADRLEGYKGNDLYIVDNVGDVVVELVGEGIDRVVADVSYTLNAQAEIEVLSTRTHAATFAIDLTGNEFSQTIYGNFGSNVLVGGGGTDTLIGMKGDDTYVVDSGDDVIFELTNGGTDSVLTSVSYILAAANEIEALAATTPTSINTLNLTGNGFAQTITGNNGANILAGGGGADTLVGLLGNDQFVFAPGFGTNTISDFDANVAGGQDLMDLRLLGVTASSFGSAVTISQQGLDTVIAIGADHIVLTNNNSSTIDINDFILSI